MASDEEAPERARRRPDGPQPRRKRSRSRSPDRPRKAQANGRRSSRNGDNRRSRSPPRSSSRRSPPRHSPPRHSPPPQHQPARRKRPGASSRIGAQERDALLQRQKRREADQERSAQVNGAQIHNYVKEAYNLVPQRGREWRRTESKISGLRSYNNWVKSTLIQKFSPNESFASGQHSADGSGDEMLRVLDIGCGKGGDLGKWQKAPQRVGLYIGVDPAEVSIEQAKGRYQESRHKSRGRIFDAKFYAKDGYGEWLGEIPIIREVGIDQNVGPDGNGSSRWGGGGFDVVTMMFCMHYAFESEEKTRGMLRNVAGALKKGGRVIGVTPNSDVIKDRVQTFYLDWEKKNKDEKRAANKPHEDSSIPEAPAQSEEEKAESNGSAVPAPEDVEEPQPRWGNSIYRVRFPRATPRDGVFRPPFGWKYSYFMEEAVEEVPEYVVPFEAFRALAEDYNLELSYRRPFMDIWTEERDDPALRELAGRMGVVGRDGELVMSADEVEAVGFYHAFCFYKV